MDTQTLCAPLPSPALPQHMLAPSLLALAAASRGVAQGCPGGRELGAGIQMRNYSAGGSVGDVIPQRLDLLPTKAWKIRG